MLKTRLIPLIRPGSDGYCAERTPGYLVDIAATAFGSHTHIEATPSETDLYYHWWIGGVYQGVSRKSVIDLHIERDDSVDVTCRAVLYADYDATADVPEHAITRYPIEWIRSADADCSYYTVAWAVGAGAPGDYTTFATVRNDDRWRYTIKSPILTEGATYWFKITSYSVNGDAGSNVEVGPVTTVRAPAAVEYTATFSDTTQRITFAGV